MDDQELVLEAAELFRQTQIHGEISGLVNRNLLVNAALKQGVNAYLPVHEQGIDLILCQGQGGAARKVRVRNHWAIEKSCEGQDIWIAFPMQRHWYLMPHDQMLRIAEDMGLTASLLWRKYGRCEKPRFSAELLRHCADYIFAPRD